MSNASGKLVIIGILTIALASAGISWWFRYNATHRSAEFWGAEQSRLIRDAPVVKFSTFSTPVTVRPSKVSLSDRDYSNEPQVTQDVTAARGLVHLRNALLDDRSFEWPKQSMWGGVWERSQWPNVKWTHALVFSDKATDKSTYVLFAPESKLVTNAHQNNALSYKPITAGVAEMFAEFERLPTSDSTAVPSR